MTTKVQRQQSITRLISERDVTSQPQLLRLLKKSGIAATQATVSRDLEDLGAVKVRTAKGDTAYAIPEFEPERIAPLEQLRRVLSEWVADIQVSHPLVIVRTPPCQQDPQYASDPTQRRPHERSPVGSEQSPVDD